MRPNLFAFKLLFSITCDNFPLYKTTILSANKSNSSKSSDIKIIAVYFFRSDNSVLCTALIAPSSKPLDGWQATMMLGFLSNHLPISSF